MRKIYIRMKFLLIIVTTGIKCIAQDDNRALLKQVIHDNQEAVYAIAMYPTETRKSIFLATEYPAIIAKLNMMQKNSQAAFEKLISKFNREEQEKIWNLTRYDGLITDLVANPKIDANDTNSIVYNYPEEIRKTAIEEHKKNYKLLVQIDKMNNNYDSDFKLLLEYPPEAVDAFKELINLPEVLGLLNDHMQYTVLIGDYYKKNPERVLHKTDSLNQVLTLRNSQEASDWKQSLEQDTTAMREYSEAAEEYAKDNGYQPEDYETPLTQDVTDYNTNSFNWWFGYPSWYPYDYWNPYPYWYDWGFYYGSESQPVFIGLPSSNFMDWYFYYPEHYSRFAELSNHYFEYYNKHHQSVNNNSISHSLNEWRSKNRDVVLEAWDKDSTNRAVRFRSFGQMEMDRQKYNVLNSRQPADRAEFLKRNQQKYPLVSVNVAKSQPINKFVNQGSLTEPINKPKVIIPNRYKAIVNRQISNNQPSQSIQEQNNIHARQNVQQNNNIQTKQVVQQHNNTHAPEIIQQRTSNIQNVNANRQQQIRKAEEYQQNTWKQIQPQQNNNPQPRQQENRVIQEPVRQNTQAPASGKRR